MKNYESRIFELILAIFILGIMSLGYECERRRGVNQELIRENSCLEREKRVKENSKKDN